MKKEDLLKILPSIYERVIGGESITSISKEYSIGRYRVAQFLKEKYGYESPSAKYSKMSGKKDYEIIDEIAYSRIVAGEKLTSVAKDLGIKRHSLSKRLNKKYNLTVLANGKNDIDSEFFSELNSVNSYWLGYIYADGCISNGKIEITSKDFDIISNFKRDIKSKNKIMEKIINGKVYYRWSVSDSKLVEDLFNLGVIERKSFNEVSLPSLSDENFFSFLRGFIDGDGCYFEYKHRFSTSIAIGKANINFAIQLKDRIKETMEIDFKIYEGKTCFSLVLYKKDSNNKLVRCLYKDTDLYMQRKYNKIERFLLPS